MLFILPKHLPDNDVAYKPTLSARQGVYSTRAMYIVCNNNQQHNYTIINRYNSSTLFVEKKTGDVIYNVILGVGGANLVPPRYSDLILEPDISLTETWTQDSKYQDQDFKANSEQLN